LAKTVVFNPYLPTLYKFDCRVELSKELCMSQGVDTTFCVEFVSKYFWPSPFSDFRFWNEVLHRKSTNKKVNILHSKETKAIW